MAKEPSESEKEINKPKGGLRGKKKQGRPEIEEKYLDVYVEDTKQNIAKFNEGLVGLEKRPDDMENINNLFRLVHTIKGASGMMNVGEVQEVAHGMEGILAVVRERRSAFEDMFPLLFKGIDTIDGLVRSLEEEKRITADVAPMVGELNDYLSRLPKAKGQGGAGAAVSVLSGEDLLRLLAQSGRKKELLTLARGGGRIFKIVLSIGEKIPMKSMKALLVRERLEKQGMFMMMAPDPESIDDAVAGPVVVNALFCAAMDLQDIRTLIFFDGVDVLAVEGVKPAQLEDTLREKNDDAASAPKEAGEEVASTQASDSVRERPAPQSSTIRMDTHKLDTLMNLSGELITVRAKFERLLTLFNDEMIVQKDFARTLHDIQSDYERLCGSLNGLIPDDPSDTERMQTLRLIARLGGDIRELSQRVVKSCLGGQIHAMDEITGSLGKIALDIQAGVMQARMVPIKEVFSRFRRITRDISNDVGKQIHLVIEGEETELDKNLVDSLGDPLTHMVRNAVSHGIEAPEVRRACGKSERGTVTLRAFHQGNNICIEVADDGKGLDPGALVQSALDKKLITAQKAARLTEKEKLDLMFLPGFSTAAEVTGLSGRGVGMDAVKNMVEAINGAVDVESRPAEGTTFILKIPLTLAVIQALLVVVGEETYAIPLDAVVEIVKVTGDTVYSVDGNATVKLRDHALSLVTLEDMIHIKRTGNGRRTIQHVVVISEDAAQIGVVVDGLIGESEVVIKSLPHHFSQVDGISGVTILGDGRIALILDPKCIMRGAKQQMKPRA